MSKYTQSDVDAVAAIVRSARDITKRPFALLTGAGCSVTAGIPLARDLMKEIEEKLPHRLNGVDAKQRESYGFCMGCLPEAEQRFILHPHLDSSKINWAHIAIAGMMAAGYIERVLTFNFDNVLARACGLAGLYPPIYDFAAAPTETTSHIGSKAIVHLHGQGHGFSMFNSEEKTRRHARSLRPLLVDSFDRFPFLVLGYSGESDAIFPEIEQIFYGRHDLIWAGYSEEPAVGVSRLLSKADRVARYIGDADADRFLLALAKALDCMPTLFDDPYGHLLNELIPVADFPVDGQNERDVLSDLRHALGEAQKRLKAETTSISALFRAQEFDRLVALFESAGAKDEGEKELVYWAFLAQGSALADLALPKGDAKLFGQAFEKYRRATEIRPDSHGAFNNWGIALARLALLKGDAGLFEQAFEKYRRAAEIKPDSHEAFYNWGIALDKLGKLKGDAGLFEQACEKYLRAAEIKPDSHEALYNWGIALDNLGKLKGDEGLYEQAFEKYRRAAEIKPDEYEALNNWGIALDNLGTLKGDAGLYEQAFEKYRRATEIKPERNEAFNNWGTALAGLARLKGDAGLYEQAFEKYRRATEIKPDAHDAFHNWGSALIGLWRLTADDLLLHEAKRVLSIAQELSGLASYNLACLHAVRGDIGAAKAQLERCEAAGTLPEASHLATDADLEALRGLEWFEALLARRGG